jgi:methylenetetrahydrofolate dehydrogenase (NADP+) / methenyltetrahydrofolate cyclohydrolase
MEPRQTILDGALLAKEIEADIALRVARLKERYAIIPTLAAIMVGDDPSSKIYVNMKERACLRCGINPEKIILDPRSATEEVLETIRRLNERPQVFGILLQHPVPRSVDEALCFEAISPEKDVDGVTAINFGRMALGKKALQGATPSAIMRLLAHYRIPVAGKNAVVVGRSAILGKPVSMLLLNADATVTICHSKTEDLESIARSADILVAAVGRPGFVRADWIREGCVLVDAGYHKGCVGDIERAAYSKASAYTPIPGGVGPMTIAMLMEQTVDAAERSVGATG